MKTSPEDFSYLQLLGRGGWGTTFKAREKETGKIFAIKIANLDKIQEFDPELYYLNEEIETLQVLSALPNACDYISCYHSHFTTKDSPLPPDLLRLDSDLGQVSYLAFIVMDYIDTGSLAKILDASLPPSPELALSLLLNLARALKFVHGAGYAHRDLHIDNVMLESYSCRPKLIDFGLSCNTKKRNCNSKQGSPRTMPPEAFVEPYNFPKARKQDIFSLGMIFYQFLNKARPAFETEPIYYGETKYLRPIIEKFHPSTYPSKELNDIIASMLNKTDYLRPTTSEIVSRLENLIPFFTFCELPDGTRVSEKKTRCAEIGGYYRDPLNPPCNFIADTADTGTRRGYSIPYSRRESYY